MLGGTYLLRAVGDTGPTWLSWLSPTGWALHPRPYAGERWWVAGMFIVFAAGFMTGGYALEARRDVGAGLLPERPGAAEAAPSLRSPLALAWRLHRGWTIGLALTGAVMGGAAAGIGNLKSPNHQLTDILSGMGGSSGITDAFLAAIFGITGMVAAAYTVQATLRLRQEESTGRVEALLATPVGRVRWAASHLAFALVCTALLLAVSDSGPLQDPRGGPRAGALGAHAGPHPTTRISRMGDPSHRRRPVGTPRLDACPLGGLGALRRRAAERAVTIGQLGTQGVRHAMRFSYVMLPD